jgi:hypothetical protein
MNTITKTDKDLILQNLTATDWDIDQELSELETMMRQADLPVLDLRRVEDNSEQANDLFEFLKIKIISSGVDLEEVPKIEGSKASGAINTKKNEIKILTRTDIGRGELFKTLAHEYGHALYENLVSRKHEDHSYAFEECVVESSAMIVACKFGLDIAPYDASYVASWSKGDKEMYKNGLSKASALAKKHHRKYGSSR